MTEVTFPKLELQDFNLLSEVNSEDRYYLPRSASFGSGDCIVLPSTIFQVTVADVHPIQTAPLETIVAHMNNLVLSKKQKIRGNWLTIRLYFVVPPIVFHNLYEQPFHTTTGTVSLVIPTSVQFVEQWALELT